MARRPGRWDPSPVTLVVVGAAFALVGNLATNTVQVSWTWWPVVVWTLAGLLLAISVALEVSGRTGTHAAATSAQIRDAKDILAGLVAEQWTAEATLRSLDDPYPIPVHWRLSELADLSDYPNAGTAVEGSSDDVDQLVGAFRALDRRRLMILGGPGTGKTTLAVQFVLRLLVAPRHDDPVPVLVSVAEWDVQAYPRLQDWLVIRLAQLYPALRATALGDEAPRILAARSHVLPVLDGLDEVAAPVRARMITALNRSMSAGDQLIVTSRTDEYARAVRDAAAVIRSAAVIQPQTLSPDVVAEYLRRSLPRHTPDVWERILTALCAPIPADSATSALAEVTSTPLGVWLVRAVYLAPAADPAQLLDADRYPSAGVLRAALLDSLIPALVDTRPPVPGSTEPFRPRYAWDPAQVRHWLGYLAHHLNQVATIDEHAGRRDFAWWDLARHSLRPGTVPLVAGLMGGLFPGFKNGWMSSSWANDSPGFADLRAAGRIRLLLRLIARCILRLGLVTGTAVGLVSGLLTGLGAGAQPGLAAGLGVALVVGLVSGSVDGLVEWAETPTPEGRASTPMANWRADRALNLTRSITGGIAGGLIIGLMVVVIFALELTPGLGFTSGIGLAAGFWIGLAVGLVFGPALGIAVWMVFGGGLGLVLGIVLGVVAGLVAGLAAGKHHAWIAYLIGAGRLARDGHLPFRLMHFLDDAHKLGLLRAVGPIYQFRHAELQDHLVATAPPIDRPGLPGHHGS